MGTRINMRMPITKAYTNADADIGEYTPEDKCDFYIEYDVSGLTDLANIDLVFTYDYWKTAEDVGNMRVHKLTGRIQFLDSSKNVLEEHAYTFSGSSNTLSYSVPSGTAFVKVTIDTMQIRRIGYGDDVPNISLDSIYNNERKVDFLKLVLKDSGGSVLDEVALNTYQTLCPPLRGDNTYSVSGVNPQLEINYSLVNTLQYCKYIGFAIDEVSGTPADTDKLYLELYKDTTKRDSTYILGQDIKSGTVIKLPQSSTDNSDANKMVIRVESSGRYFQVKGHIVWFYDPVIGTEAY